MNGPRGMDQQTSHAPDNSRQTAMEASEPEVVGKPVCNRSQERACMCCERTFISEGWHNRLCLECRKRT